MRTDKPVDAGSARAMENYREFLNLKSNDPALRARAMRRLGDLNLEASEIERGEREQSSADALQSGEAIKLYTALLESYPEYRQSDGVLYQLARAYESNGQPEQALDALDRLVSRFGSSALIDEAQFRRGEILFSAKRYQGGRTRLRGSHPARPSVHLLRAEPLQARLVAVQAGA